jgi:hypothetical protein
VTVNDAAPWLPCASVAVQLTVVTRREREPLAARAATGPSNASVAEAVNV